jgi:Histidine kinase-, DNA gyrase B-, and HSP90-like ATPase
MADVQPTLTQHMLTISIPPGSLMINGDALRLEQVVQNLLQNAIKYSPAGGLITVQVAQHAQLACVIVTDQGGSASLRMHCHASSSASIVRPTSIRAESAGWESGCMWSRRSSRGTAARSLKGIGLKRVPRSGVCCRPRAARAGGLRTPRRGLQPSGLGRITYPKRKSSSYAGRGQDRYPVSCAKFISCGLAGQTRLRGLQSVYELLLHYSASSRATRRSCPPASSETTPP